MIYFSKHRYGCFSNFYQTEIYFDNMLFFSSEAAFQSQKCAYNKDKQNFQTKSPQQAKILGRRVKLRSDWEDVKYNVMVDVCYAKFIQHPDLKAILLSTENEELIEDTTGWHDNIWGSCNCSECKNIKGQNLLGKALMEVRTKIRETF